MNLPPWVLLFCGSAPLFATAKAEHDAVACTCEIAPLPDLWNKELTARWMVHSLDWGVLSTISSRLVDSENQTMPVPFSNVYSFVDGTCHQGTGIPYFYGTYLDQSFKDILHNNNAAFTLSEAYLSSVCLNSVSDENNSKSMKRKACQIGLKHGDPENPVCARLTLTGKLVEVTDPAEKEWALDALFQRHASMKEWPSDHDWVVGKLNLTDIWLIDFFGGASIIDLDDYFGADDLAEGGADDEEKH